MKEGLKERRDIKAKNALEVEKLYQKTLQEMYRLQDEIDGIDYQLYILEKIDNTIPVINGDSDYKELSRALSNETKMQALRMKKKRLEYKRDNLI